MNRPPQTPNRHIMALATYCGLLPLVYFIPPVVSKFIDDRLIVTAISLALIVPVMSYLVLPKVGKLLSMRTIKKT